MYFVSSLDIIDSPAALSPNAVLHTQDSSNNPALEDSFSHIIDALMIYVWLTECKREREGK